MVVLNKDKEIERLLDALMQEKRENARLREALQMLSNYGSPAPRQWWAEDIRRIALAALGEEK